MTFSTIYYVSPKFYNTPLKMKNVFKKLTSIYFTINKVYEIISSICKTCQGFVLKFIAIKKPYWLEYKPTLEYNHTPMK